MTNDNPLISIVIPAYNSAKLIEDTLDSVMAQDYRPIEIIIVDDGSKDDTAAVVEGYSGPIRLISQKNAGPGIARNTGIKECRGEFVAFIDADDLWHPNKLSQQYAVFTQNPQFGAVFCHYSGGDPAGFHFDTERANELELDESKSGWVYCQLILEVIVQTSTLMVRKSILDRFDPVFATDRRIGEDYDFWFRLSRETQMAKLKEPLSFYRRHSGSITARSVVPKVPFDLAVIDRALETWGGCDPQGRCLNEKEINGRRTKIMLRHARTHAKHGELSVAFEYCLKVLATTPFNISVYKTLLMSLAASFYRPFQR